MKNKFKFVIPSYNNEEFVEYNLASILNQTYQNYEVLYIDDASTDNTYNRVVEIVSNDNRFKVIRREENKGAAYNYFFELEDYLNNDDDIIIHLDGDDWLYDENVLENLLKFYEEKDVWMTYGKFYCYDGTDQVAEANPQNTPHSEFVINHKIFRRDTWRASHLRTYKTFLFKALDKEDLYSKIDGKLFWHALDLAFQYPYMEMSSPNRIGVVDFPTCVYNQAPKNAERTQVREHSNNIEYEYEIRNKKIYKSGLSGEKLPQISVFGDYLETHDIPKLFSYCYNRTYGDFDATVLYDEGILKYDYSKKTTKLIARICENRNFFNQKAVVDFVLKNSHLFDLILSWDKEILTLPNSKFCPISEISQFNILPKSDYEFIPKWDDRIIQKTKSVSAVSSNKQMLPGHVKRLDIIKAIMNKVDLFGRGIREIDSKLEALGDYRFSVAIENDKQDNYFTEKITDCFRTGVIPIYYGCPNIGDFFDINGIITFNSIEELKEILNNLSTEKYNSKIDAIKYNFNKCKNYPSNNDSLFTLYYNDLINKK